MISLFLLVVLVLTLCACGSGGNDTTTASTAQDTTAGTTETTGAAKPTYTVKVVDESGNPIFGAVVQLCLDMCYPAVTDASGIATWNIEEAEYKVSIAKAPEGYSYSIDENFYFHHTEACGIRKP